VSRDDRRTEAPPPPAVTAFLTALQQGDATAAVTSWHDEAFFVERSGRETRGRGALLERLKAFLAKVPEWNLTVVESWRFDRPESYLLRTRYSTEGGIDGLRERDEYVAITLRDGRIAAWKEFRG